MSGPPPPYPFMPRPGMPPMPMPGMPPPGMMPYGAPRPLFPVGGPPPMPPHMFAGPPRPQSVMARPQFLSTMARPPVLLPKPNLPAAERVPKKTTIYVGKIAPTVDEQFIKQLLEACGEMKSWKRVEDPVTHQLKGFGFCEFEEADGCQRALRLLNSLKVDGQELLLKPDSATQKYLDEYQKDKDQADKEKKAKKAAEAEQGEVVQEETEEEKDNDVLVKIMGLLSDRAEKVPKQKADNERAIELLASMEKPRERERDREEKHSVLPGPPIRDLRTERQIEAARALEMERQKERELERAFEIERQQKKREEDAKKRESDRAYDVKCREWDKMEREALRIREREKQKQKEAEYERFKQIRADLEVMDTDDDLEPWARKPYRTSRRAEERRRKRAKEELDDEEDRLREAAELEELARRQAEAEEQRRQMQEEAGVKEEEESGAARMEHDAAQAKPEPEPAFDPNDAIYQAMIAAAKAPPPIKYETPPHASPQPQPAHGASTSNQPRPSPEHAPAQSSQRTPPHQSQPLGISLAAKKPNLAAIFGEEEEESPSKKRKLVPLQYTEEEQRAVRSATVEDPKTLLRIMADSIPTTKEGVFRYKIKWDAYDPETVAAKLSKWVEQKIKELVGVEMPDVVSFIMELLQGHAAPQKMFDEVHPIIDTDAESFVIKLYRMVIFETEKAASGL